MSSDRKPTTVERRCAGQSTAVEAHTGHPARTCQRCGCTYLDYQAGRDAHQAVFGHGPQRQQPANVAATTTEGGR